MIGIFSFFAGAGFLDLGFEKTGHFKTLYVNEFKPSFNYIYRYAREKMGIEPPILGIMLVIFSNGYLVIKTKNYIRILINQNSIRILI